MIVTHLFKSRQNFTLHVFGSLFVVPKQQCKRLAGKCFTIIESFKDSQTGKLVYTIQFQQQVALVNNEHSAHKLQSFITFFHLMSRKFYCVTAYCTYAYLICDNFRRLEYSSFRIFIANVAKFYRLKPTKHFIHATGREFQFSRFLNPQNHRF